MLHAVAEGLLGFLEIAAGIVALFVADLAIDFEHAFDVLTHMSDDWAGESVLGVGVNVHLNHSVIERFLEVLGRGSGTSVKDEVHFGFGSVFVGDNFLAIAQNGRFQFDRARFVGAVNVAKGGGKHEAADGAQGFVNLHHVLGRGVELLGRKAGSVMTVFFSANAASFDLKNDVELDALLEEFGGDPHIFVEVNNRSIKHVGLEKRALAPGDALTGSVEEGAKEGIDLFGVTVIGVKSDENVVFLGEGVDSLSEDNGSERSITDGGAGRELTTSGRDLDDAVGLGFSKSLEGSVGGGKRGDVDGGISVSTLLGGIEHLGVLFWGRDWHDCEGVTLDRWDWQGWSCAIPETLSWRFQERLTSLPA